MILFFLILTALAVIIVYYAAILAIAAIILITRVIRVASGKTTFAELMAKDEKAKQARVEWRKAHPKKRWFAYTPLAHSERMRYGAGGGY